MLSVYFFRFFCYGMHGLISAKSSAVSEYHAEIEKKLSIFNKISENSKKIEKGLDKRKI